MIRHPRHRHGIPVPASSASTSGFYVSYRRDDTRHVAGLLARDLAAVFGEQRVMVDTQMPAGEDAREFLARSLASCQAMLVLIGPRWLTSADARGLSRLQSPDDWVRTEIAAVLRSERPVVPVLVDGAAMPHADDLPADLKPLTTRNAVTVSTGNWRSDVQHLARLLATLDPPDPSPSSLTDSISGGLRSLFGNRAPPPAPRAPTVAARPAAPKPAPAPVKRPVSAQSSAGKDIFISYAFEDEAWAQRVVQALEPLGFACWVASRDIVPGTPSYAREITRAIRTSRLFIVLLSAASNESDDVLNEITLAKDNKVPRLPLRIDDTPLGDGMLYFFSQAQRLEGGGLDEAAVIARLTASVQQQLGAPA